MFKLLSIICMYLGFGIFYSVFALSDAIILRIMLGFCGIVVLCMSKDLWNCCIMYE